MGRRFGIVWCFWRIAAVAAMAIVCALGPAWGFAAWEQRKDGVFHNRNKSNVWASERVVKIGGDPISSILRVFTAAPSERRDYSKFGTSLIEYGEIGSPFIGTQGWSFGWPCRCLRFTNVGAPVGFPSGSVITKKTVWVNGWELEPSAGKTVILPIRPVAWGMAWNLGVWGVVFGGLLLGVPLGKRILRGRRGLCASCGYDLNALGAGTNCPECGHPRAEKGISAVGVGDWAIGN